MIASVKMLSLLAIVVCLVGNVAGVRPYPQAQKAQTPGVRGVRALGPRPLSSRELQKCGMMETCPPTAQPSSVPSQAPSVSAQPSRSASPSTPPTISLVPSSAPTNGPTAFPSATPSAAPTISAPPSQTPSVAPSAAPSASPSATPSISNQPSISPRPTVSAQPSLDPLGIDDDIFSVSGTLEFNSTCRPDIPVNAASREEQLVAFDYDVDLALDIDPKTTWPSINKKIQDSLSQEYLTCRFIPFTQEFYTYSISSLPVDVASAGCQNGGSGQCYTVQAGISAMIFYLDAPVPTGVPSVAPTISPVPTASPTIMPTALPTTMSPTGTPTIAPTLAPSESVPTAVPTTPAPTFITRRKLSGSTITDENVYNAFSKSLSDIFSSGILLDKTVLATRYRGITNAPAFEPQDKGSPNVGAIVGGVLGGLAALILIVLLIILVQKRRRSRPYQQQLDEGDARLDNVAVEAGEEGAIETKTGSKEEVLIVHEEESEMSPPNPSVVSQEGQEISPRFLSTSGAMIAPSDEFGGPAPYAEDDEGSLPIQPRSRKYDVSDTVDL